MPALIKALLLAATLAAPSAAAPAPKLFDGLPLPLQRPLAQDPLKTTIHRLDNGLTVYLSPNHEQPRIAAQIAVRAGGRNDPGEATGMAHYLEHMLFKGTPKLGTLDYAKEKVHLDRISDLYDRLFAAADPDERARIYAEIDRENVRAARYAVPNEMERAYGQMGFKGLNAYTNDEATVYVCELPSNRLKAWAVMESERFRLPVFRLFQSEIEAVYEEKNRGADNAERVLEEELAKVLYGEHPYGRSVLGLSRHLKNPSMTRMRRFYDDHYRPNNMAVALSGDFDPGEAMRLIRKHFGAWKTEPVPRPAETPLPRFQSPRRLEVPFEAEEKVVIAWPTAPARHPDADALIVMDMLMDNAAAGLINLDLQQAQKVKSAGSYPELMSEAGSWRLWAVPKKGQSLEQAEALLLQTVGKLKAGAFDAEDMRAVVTDFEVSQKARLESNEARAGLMAASFVERRPWSETVGFLDRLRRVTKPDVLRVARQYLGEGRIVAYRRNKKPEIARLAKPKFTPVAIDPSRSSDFFRRVLAVPAKALEPRWIKEGRDYAVQALASGALYTVKNPFNDLFSLEWRFDRGFRQERRLCEALDLLTLSGAENLAAEEFKKKLYGLGASLSYGCGEDESSVHLSGIDKNLEAALELMRQRFDSPRIEADTLEKMVEVELGAREDEKRDPRSVSHALGELARRGKDSAVLARLSNAELKTLNAAALQSITRGVMDFKRRMAYVGNRPQAEAARFFETGSRPYADPGPRAPLRFARPARPEIFFAKRDMVQALVGVFASDEVFDRGHAVDYEFLGQYLGGGMSSLIFQEIREARSLAYSAGGGYSPGGHSGDENILTGGLGCQADKTREAARLLREILRSPPWSAERFQETANAILENYRAKPIPFRGIPGALMHWENQGYPPGDPRPERYEKMLRYRMEDLKGFAERFKEAPMTIFALGPDGAGKELKALGNFREKKLEEIFPY